MWEQLPGHTIRFGGGGGGGGGGGRRFLWSLLGLSEYLLNALSGAYSNALLDYSPLTPCLPLPFTPSCSSPPTLRLSRPSCRHSGMKPGRTAARRTCEGGSVRHGRGHATPPWIWCPVTHASPAGLRAHWGKHTQRTPLSRLESVSFRSDLKSLAPRASSPLLHPYKVDSCSVWLPAICFTELLHG